MADETKVQADEPAKAPAKVDAAADAAVNVAKVNAQATKRDSAPAAPKAKRRPTAARTTAAKTSARRAKVAVRKTRKAASKPAAAAKKRIETMTNNQFFTGFDAIPAFAPFQSLFADANERSQQLAGKTHKVAEQLADLTRANVEALVESSRLAAEGARSIGQDAVASSRKGAEQAADAIRSLAEAKSPTEYLQLQSEFARTSFDRAVAETSKLTESLVKLAGEAFQPLSNRATANAERLNTLVA